MDIYLSSAYLAPVQYYSKFLGSNCIFIEQNENYVKQTYRNRCAILGANGAMFLSVPIQHSSGEKIAIRDVKIADHDNWQHMHWNAIVSAYNSTPFFEYYQDDFYPFYHKKYTFLFDFNEQLQATVLDLLNIDYAPVSYTEVYKTEFTDAELDFRNSINPKKDWKQFDNSFCPKPYYQVFDQKFGFVENMSIIDLLFNMGNESQIILQESVQ